MTSDSSIPLMATSRCRVVAGLLIIGLLVVGALIGIVAWLTSLDGENSVPKEPNSIPSTSLPGASITLGDLQFRKMEDGYKLNIKLDSGGQGLSGTVGRTVDGDPSTCLTTEESAAGKKLCLEWTDLAKLTVKQRMTNVNLSQEMVDEINCFDVTWEATQCQSQILKDCFVMADTHWYGGAEDWYQYWPLERWSRDESPYVAGDSYAKQFGGVLERYFFNTKGFAIFVDKEVPLHVSINKTGDQELCLISKYGPPYNNYDDSLPHLNYTVCRASNVKTIHDYMSGTYFRRARDIPDKRLFRSPIWSTWAQFKKDVDETKVMKLANDILSHNFSHSQLEIDDDWTVHYGDMEFNQTKFPEPVAMINNLTSLGFRTTIWLHTFANIDSQAFQYGATKKYFVTEPRGKIPALVSWWRGQASAVLDVTNPSAFEWYLRDLKRLRDDYGISSFKFDAGEVSWLPAAYKCNQTFRNPDDYTTRWAELAYESDKDVRHQEVRVGSRSQHLPIFVRMLDRDSNWGYENGLKTMIPVCFTFGLLGYPFILPDMIGGNAYDGGLDGLALPEPELFVRWIQLNAFLPAMQFSIVPWNFNDSIVKISRQFVQLHEEYSARIIELAEEYTRTGAPIIRPLWWIAPNDEHAQTIDSEFLLGNDILVAPIVERGARERDIYLPAGQWFDHMHESTRQGGEWYRGYKVELEDLAYFTRQ